MLQRSRLFVWSPVADVETLTDRKSKPPTLNCRRATDGSITAKVNGGGGEGVQGHEVQGWRRIRKEWKKGDYRKWMRGWRKWRMGRRK